MTIRVVSTVHKKGWEAYGAGWRDGVHLWKDAEFVLYTEGFGLTSDQIKAVPIETVDRCVSFKRVHEHYIPPTWTTDVVRWSNKVFASYDALYNYEGLAVWLDADCVTFKEITEEHIRSMLPPGHYMAMFKRIGLPTETGFVVRDCSHPIHKTFMDTWVRWFESGSFKTLNQWCDASTMDATCRLFEKQGLLTASLSGEFDKELSPMDLAPLSNYITHRKGSRKWQ
jgi:hypothetical protein